MPYNTEDVLLIEVAELDKNGVSLLKPSLVTKDTEDVSVPWVIVGSETNVGSSVKMLL